ncbi:MAG: hypothetical protein A2046_06815 [Bacteroidetes bacterium GWA2_30_7]|nr:MAG: hypothetical protein A2046_06815 [Bacteroidetes bacterium GWA2_30_7]
MKHFVFLILVIIIGCQISENEKIKSYKLISYLDIKVDSLGNLPQSPYIVDLQNNKKHLIVIGTLHSRDTSNKMFTEIEKVFTNFKPDIAINEGGQINKTYTNRNTAIIKNGETGLLKYLCDKQNIKMINGDMPDSLEFNELSKNFSKKEALFFFASERFVLPCTYWNEKENLDSLYETDFIEGYLFAEGIKLTQEEKLFSFYKSMYKLFFYKEFNLENINSDDFSPIRKNHHFCEVARKSKELRDKYLLKKIEEQLTSYDKILIVFGGWHVLAIEPALNQIIFNK